MFINNNKYIYISSFYKISNYLNTALVNNTWVFTWVLTSDEILKKLLAALLLSPKLRKRNLNYNVAVTCIGAILTIPCYF